MVWQIAAKKVLVTLWKKQGKMAALWLMKQVGGDFAFDQIKGQAGKTASRQRAISKARQIAEGRFGALIVEGKTHYVVYSGDIPVDLIPASEKDLAQITQHYDLVQLRDPDDLGTARSRAAFNNQWQELRMRLRREEDSANDVPTSGATEALDPEVPGQGEARGTAAFDAVVAEMPGLLDQLTAAPAVKLADKPTIPEAAGVYLFSEEGAPLYLGQSRNLRRRLREHTSRTSKENQAPFAFNLARREAERRELTVSGTRQQLAADPEFKSLFTEARERAAKMDVQFIVLEDAMRRYIFEPYATQVLGTEMYNSFETH